MKYTSRADLLIAAGESIKMQENAGVNEPVVKYNGEIAACDELNYTTRQHGEYEFPLAVVEGKPVFVGDELWNVPNNFKFVSKTTRDYNGEQTIWGDTDFKLDNQGRSGGWVKDCSWNPPKPKTVMVELLREDAEEWAEMRGLMTAHTRRMVEACRKALEKA